jgi:hypothetical protein
MGHRGHKSDPLYRCRRLLTKADERIDEKGREKLLGLLRAGDPRGEVTTTWHAKDAVRELYTHTDATLALDWLERLYDDIADTDNPIEVRSLGRTSSGGSAKSSPGTRRTSPTVPPRRSTT